jgi:hypothetical protein
VSRDGDNNAWIASLLMQGTGLMSFVGRYAWVGEAGAGPEAVAVTERDEPQAVIGSRLHEMAFPEGYRAHVAGGSRLREAYGHGGNVLSLQLRHPIYDYAFVTDREEGLVVVGPLHTLLTATRGTTSCAAWPRSTRAAPSPGPRR